MYVCMYVCIPTQGSNPGLPAMYIEDLSLISGWERSPGEGNGNPFQYSCLENFMDRGAWQATVHGVARSQTRLRDYYFHTHIHTHTYTYISF